MRWVRHLHHETLLEPVGPSAPTNSLSYRKGYVASNKDRSEVPLRLKYMKTVKGPLPKKFLEAFRDWNGYYGDDIVNAERRSGTVRAIRALHRKELPNSPWRGRGLQGDLFAAAKMVNGVYVEKGKRTK